VDKKAISTDRAPQAIGPYSQAIAAEGVLFCSGQVALDPSSGELTDETVSGQTRRALENLKAIVEEGGSDMNRVVKVTAYLTDMGDFVEFNEVYGEFFGDTPPARATVGVSALPKGARVEVECVALI
jgi:2-iminobutanoate/2-iminopropanoate deaminase